MRRLLDPIFLKLFYVLYISFVLFPTVCSSKGTINWITRSPTTSEVYSLNDTFHSLSSLLSGSGSHSFSDVTQMLISSKHSGPCYKVLNVAAIAPWFRLRLPSCGPGFKSQAYHLCFFSICIEIVTRKEQK